MLQATKWCRGTAAKIRPFLIVLGFPDQILYERNQIVIKFEEI